MQAVFPFESNFPKNPCYDVDMPQIGRPSKNDRTQVGERIARARERMGISQTQLAELIGVSQQVVTRWERKHANIQSQYLVKLATTLQISTDELLGLKEPAAAPKQPGNTVEKRLQKKIQEISELGPSERRQIMQHLDMVLENHRLRHQKAS